MPVHPNMPSELLAIRDRWSDSLSQLNADNDRIEYIRNELPALLLNRAIFFKLLTNIVKGGRYPNIRQAQMFEDEILLCLNPQPIFSIRMFIYQPGDYTPIHDHNSWAVIGSALGQIGVANYAREDDGSIEGYARLYKTGQKLLERGQTDVNLPLNAGIHQTGNPSGHTSIMVSVYGRPIRRIYINRFDLKNHKVYRMYSSQVKKRMLAAEALKNIEE